MLLWAALSYYWTKFIAADPEIAVGHHCVVHLHTTLRSSRLVGASSKCSELEKPSASQGAASFDSRASLWCTNWCNIFHLCLVLAAGRNLWYPVSFKRSCFLCYFNNCSISLSYTLQDPALPWTIRNLKLCREILLSAGCRWLLLLLLFLHLWELPAAWLFSVELLCPCMFTSKWVEGVSFCRQKKRCK